jgi:hypothetical protein
MKRKFVFYAVILSLAITNTNSIKAQSVAISADGSTAHSSAILDIKSITKGMLAPRMTTAQRTAITTPAAGLLVYDTNTNGFWFYNGGAWNELSTGSATNYWALLGGNVYNNNAGNVGIGTTNPQDKFTVQTLTGNVGITHTDGTITLGTYVGNNAASLGTLSNHPVGFFTNGSEQMRLLQNGNFGIGTSNPVSKLTIATPNNTDGFTHISDGGIILKEAVGGVSAIIGTSSPHTFRLVANSVAVINIDPTGNVGVGLTDPAFKMDFSDRIRIRSGSASSTAGVWLNNLSNTGTPAFIGMIADDAVGFYGSTSGWGLRMNTNLGDVAIGNTNTAGGYKLTVAGNQYLNGNLYATGDAEIRGNTLMGGSLIVSGSFPKFFGHYYSYRYSGVFGDVDNHTDNCSIVANNVIAGFELIAFSDARIKNIIGKSNSSKDLETINALRITDYTMKDKTTYGNKQFKKVIAQEVEKVYPQVVSKHTDYIPNVYQITDKIEKTANGYNFYFVNKHTISPTAKRLRVQLKDGEATKDFDIVSVPSDNMVEIKTDDLKADKIFVYGEQVDDFRSVNYEGLTTLNISATQELSKLIKKQQTIIETQQQQIDLLMKRIEALEKK